jgi:cob(I)alamin adenosyltransferase
LRWPPSRRRRCAAFSSASERASTSRRHQRPFGIADRLRINQAQIDALEADCDRFNAELPELRASSCPGRSSPQAPRRARDLPAAERDVLDAAEALTSTRS